MLLTVVHVASGIRAQRLPSLGEGAVKMSQQAECVNHLFVLTSSRTVYGMHVCEDFA